MKHGRGKENERICYGQLTVLCIFRDMDEFSL